MGVFTHIPAEIALLTSLKDADGGILGQLRDEVQIKGLPTRRSESWKWSDLRRAVGKIEGAGSLEILGLTDGSRIEGRVELKTSASSGVSAGHYTMTVGAGREAILIENHTAHADSFSVLEGDIKLGEGASLTRIVLAEDDESAVSVRRADVILARGARYRQIALGLGSRLSRFESHISHPGEEAHVEMGSLYLLKSGRHVDFTSSVHHTGPGGETRQSAKGVARAKAQAVFQGKFLVDRTAQKTDAQMEHRALMLEAGAEIDAKPELEIYADDVACAHGNAIGAIDEAALFYMRQRGLPELTARALLIKSFLAEPLDMIEDDAVRVLVESRLEAAIGAVL